GVVQSERGDTPYRLARRCAAAYGVCALVRHRLDGRRRDLAKFAGGSAVALSRHYQPDWRCDAADRTFLRGADGKDDRARRDAAQSSDRRTQSPGKEYTRNPASDRGADLSQRNADRT